MKKAEIKLQVELDENNVPENIMWSSTDGNNAEELPAKAMFLALWDSHYKNSMRIDLWTKDMPYDEMKRFFLRNFTNPRGFIYPFFRWRSHG